MTTSGYRHVLNSFLSYPIADQSRNAVVSALKICPESSDSKSLAPAAWIIAVAHSLTPKLPCCPLQSGHSARGTLWTPQSDHFSSLAWKPPHVPGLTLLVKSQSPYKWPTQFGSLYTLVIVQSLSHVWLLATPWTAACQVPCLSLSGSMLRFVSIESVILSNHLIFRRPLFFSFCLQSFPASEPFPVSRLFVSDGQSIGVSASASVLPMNIQSWFPLRLTSLISLLPKGLFKSLLQHHSLKV